MISRLTVRNYGCVKDATVHLTPLHALIGPNDSGKSTLLRALRTVVQSASSVFDVEDPEGTQASHRPLRIVGPFDPMLAWGGEEIEVAFADGLSYSSRFSPKGVFERIGWSGGDSESGPRQPWKRGGAWAGRDGPRAVQYFEREIPARLRPARMLRLDPDALRRPSALIRQGGPVAFSDERGTGLPGVVDVLLNRDARAYLDLLDEIRRLFPSVRSIGLVNVSEGTKAVEATLVDGTRVPATGMSEGLLYYLAFAVMRHLESAPVLLVEEPENGLHPARIADVVRVLREISRDTQVVLATHSPLVVNELGPEEVSVVTRQPEEGTRVRRIVDAPNFEARARVYALGELWVSYANGDDEGPLFAENGRG
ncbi:AAA family ATPase [Myxococcota bacterium]|nr:AAA family ATPase [Myxococcota bacterium]